MTQLVSKEEGGETVVNNIPNVPFMFRQKMEMETRWDPPSFRNLFTGSGKGRVPDPRRTIPSEQERHDRR